jgi:hypothetical protein
MSTVMRALTAPAANGASAEMMLTLLVSLKAPNGDRPISLGNC